MRLCRRVFLGGAAAARVGLMAPARAAMPAPVPLAVQIGWIANVEYADSWIAIERGYFRDRGLDVTVIPGGPDAPDPLVVVAAGGAAIGYTSWLPFLDAVARGNDYVLFGAGFQASPLGVISLAKQPILDARALAGKHILAQGPNESTAIRATLSLAGLDPDGWTMVPAGFSPDALLAGAGDGYTGFATNQVIILQQMGLKQDRDFFFRSFDELGFRTCSKLLFCDRAVLRQKRAQLVGYVAALIRGTRDNEADPTYAARLTVEKYGEDYGLDLDQQVLVNKAQIPYAHPGLAAGFRLYVLDPQAIARMLTQAARVRGMMLPPAERLVDFTIGQDAQAA